MKRVFVLMIVMSTLLNLVHYKSVLAESEPFEKRETAVKLDKEKLDRIKEQENIKVTPKHSFKEELDMKINSQRFSSYVDADGVYWEIEPNDTWYDADQIEQWNLIRGSIDDYNNEDEFDEDYYWIEVTSSGKIALVGITEDEYSAEGMVFDLYDENGAFITTSFTYYDDEGVPFQYFEEDVTPGIYYVNVWNTYSYEHYVDVGYAFEIRTIQNEPVELEESITRLSGGGRYETAVEISKSGWNKSEHAIIATGLNFPDALSATPLAQKYHAPLLLSDKYKLPSSVEKELKRLGVKKVILVGGQGVLSTTLENYIKKLGISVLRITGNHRYETAVNIAKHIGNNGEIVVATGENFADALSMAPVAANLQIPIVLVQKNTTPKVVQTYLKGKKIVKSYVIGGTGVISSGVAKSFPSAERISGSNRYQTNSRIIDKFKGSLDFSKLYIATGTNYPDALAGSALAAKNSSSLLLTDYYPASYTKDVINTHRSNVLDYYVLGGEAAVPHETLYNLFK